MPEPPLIAVVNLGSGSSVYERAFLDPDVFPALLDSISGGEGAATRRIQISAFSAGYGSVRAILRHHAERLHGLLLLDGLHAGYVPDGVVLFEGGTIDASNMDAFVDFAARALTGEKRFVYTHSEIFPGTYASTTETADFLLDHVGLKRRAVLEWGAGGMQLLSRADSNRLTVLGYAGNTAPDHVDHLHALPSFLNLLMNE